VKDSSGLRLLFPRSADRVLAVDAAWRRWSLDAESPDPKDEDRGFLSSALFLSERGRYLAYGEEIF
jgi:hypothetical protein